MLELGVVGTPKELWARLNEDGGLPAATLLRLACHFEGLHAEAGERSRAILELLKPGLLQSLDIDDPRRASQSAKAIAERRGRNKSIAKVQNLFRLSRSLKPAAADPFTAFSRPTTSANATGAASGAASNFASLVRAAKLGNGLVANDSPRWAKAWGGAFGAKAGSAAAASVLNAQATGADAISKLTLTLTLTPTLTLTLTLTLTRRGRAVEAQGGRGPRTEGVPRGRSQVQVARGRCRRPRWRGEADALRDPAPASPARDGASRGERRTRASGQPPGSRDRLVLSRASPIRSARCARSAGGHQREAHR